MLFNSYTFLLAFLPVTLAGFFIFGQHSKIWGSTWLALASLVFYGWWDVHYIPLLLGSIAGNYWMGRQIARHAGTDAGKRALIAGVVGNLALLGYYKYADFFIGSGNALLGTEWPVLKVVLPIGVSFFTFTQIAFLADAYAGKVKEVRFVYYLLFVTYFPHLIAGPVLHHKEMMPQFDLDRNYRPQASNFSVGMTIFAIGLAKKVLVADSLAVHAAPLFAEPGNPSLFVAWGAALAYTFQLYFDFSGYSDMAIGLSRLFGVQLPLNFNSPYKARNIADFWRRWHMTLSRFLRDYLYIPLGGNRHGPMRRQLNLMLTMVLGGMWHGAGWTFIVWGAMHGTFLVVHQAWSGLVQRLGWRLPQALVNGLSVLITFLCVVFAWVYFRAADMASANQIVLGMLGANGAALPDAIANRLGPFGDTLKALGVGTSLGSGSAFVETWAWIMAAAVLSFVFPNTQEIMRHFEPALTEDGRQPAAPKVFRAWQPKRTTAVLAGLLLGLGVMALTRPTEFLYFQF